MQTRGNENDTPERLVECYQDEVDRLKRQLSIKQRQIDLLTVPTETHSTKQSASLKSPSSNALFTHSPVRPHSVSSSQCEPAERARLLQTIKQLKNDLSISQSLNQSKLDERDRRISSLILSVNRLREERDYLLSQSVNQSDQLSTSRSVSQSVDSRLARLEITHRAHQLNNQSHKQSIELPNWLPRDARYLIRAFVSESIDQPSHVFDQSNSQSQAIVDFSINLSNVWRQKMHDRVYALKQAHNESVNQLKRQLNARIPYTALIKERSVNQTFHQSLNQSEFNMLDAALDIIDKLEAQIRQHESIHQSTNASINEAVECVRFNTAAFIDRVIELTSINQSIDQSTRDELENECDQFMAVILENLAINEPHIDELIEQSIDTS